MSGARPAGKVLPDVRAALQACGLRDGATISFHHHLRNGDAVLNRVLDEAAALGLRDLTVAASSLFPVHAPLLQHIRSGVVGGLSAAYVAGPLGEALARGALARPLRMYTHGGRARAIEAGELHIDAAFVAAPTADAAGNLDGSGGPAAFGPMGYPMVDVRYADHVVAVTDHLVPYPACPIDIGQQDVDFVVVVERIGDARGIVSGTTQPTTDPLGLRIAGLAADAIAASGLLVDGFSFQTGAGGISLAAASSLATLMHERRVRGSFAAGGITGALVEMFEAGLFGALLDVQCFDLRAVESYRRHAAHQSMSASVYASPHRRGAVVDRLDAVILGATEIDLDFNVNVTTGSDGVIRGGSGGHADAAAGARLAIVTTRLSAGGHRKVVERVRTTSTPGSTVDLLVTDEGMAVHPRRGELRERLLAHGLPVVDIAELQARAAQRAPASAPVDRSTRPAAIVEYRDGSVLDLVPTLG